MRAVEAALDHRLGRSFSRRHASITAKVSASAKSSPRRDLAPIPKAALSLAAEQRECFLAELRHLEEKRAADAKRAVKFAAERPAEIS
jgi:hypothetical protein